MASKKGTRAVAAPGLGIGNHRYELYATAWARVQLAQSKGFYLEAITLLESLISDRLESRAKHLTGKNHGFSTLGELIKLYRKFETSPAFKTLVERIDNWRAKRNAALHEMVKFSQGEFPSWKDRTALLPAIVREGQAILRDFAAEDEVSRRSAGAKPPATWPNVFGEVDAPRSRRRTT